MESSSRFLITDSVAETLKFYESGDRENAFNFASLVVWRVDRYQSWLTVSESEFIDLCLAYKTVRKRRKS